MEINEQIFQQKLRCHLDTEGFTQAQQRLTYDNGKLEIRDIGEQGNLGPKYF